MHRVGIIPLVIRGGEFTIFLVTSRTRGRWILPKGVIKRDETHQQACLREVFEEAGVAGIGLARRKKVVGPGGFEPP